MKPISVYASISAAILLVLLISAISLNACSAKRVEKLVIPDSHDLQAGIVCQWNDQAEPHDCYLDPNRVTIDLGYLREIIDLLDACRKKQI